MAPQASEGSVGLKGFPGGESCPGFPGGTSEPFIKLKRGRGGFGEWGGRRTACDSRILWAAANDTLAHSPHPTTCARIHDPDHYTVRASPRRRTLPDAKQNVPCEVSISALRRMKVGHTCRAYRPICGSSHLLCQIASHMCSPDECGKTPPHAGGEEQQWRPRVGLAQSGLLHNVHCQAS